MSRGRRPTAKSPEDRENQIVAMAYDLAEKQIREGTASAQVISHFLKLGSPKDRLEREILAEQKKLVAAKTENLESSKRIEGLYKDAMDAMKRYSGQSQAEDYEDSDIF